MVEQTSNEAVSKVEAVPSVPATSIIDKADMVARRIEDGVKRYEEMAARIEGAAARIMLGGRAEAGSISKTEEEKKKEFIQSEINKRLGK